MDIKTFIQKVSDTIYYGCDKKRKYKEILKNIQTSIDNENITPVPYYYISVLNVLEDMGIEDYNDSAMEEKLKKYSRELTLNRLSVIVSDMFERHFDDDEEVVENVFKKLKTKVHVSNLAKAFEDEYELDLYDFIVDLLDDDDLLEKYVLKPVRVMKNYKTV